jgi:diguanylate cyclase (GGDEF)-like protein
MAEPDVKIGALFIDLDDFKRINDEHGHGVGDQVLVEVAARLRSACRKRDIVSRLGGDEFVILCRLATDDGIDAIAARVEQLLLADVLTDAGPIRIRASVGLGVSVGEGDLGRLLRDADHALYRAKRDAKSASEWQGRSGRPD